jgi:DNA-binding SARP family transcriptional activator
VDDQWAVVERERLTIIQLRGRGLMMRSLAEECRYEEALEYGHSILAIDPFRESTLREVMWLHVLNGERPRALRLFQEFRASLFEEMGISPTTETHALREHIAQDSLDAVVRPGLDPDGDASANREPIAPRISSYLQDRLSRIQQSRVEVYRSLQATRI